MYLEGKSSLKKFYRGELAFIKVIIFFIINS